MTYTSITIEYKFITAQNMFDLSHNSDSHLQGRKDQLTSETIQILTCGGDNMSSMSETSVVSNIMSRRTST